MSTLFRVVLLATLGWATAEGSWHGARTQLLEQSSRAGAVSVATNPSPTLLERVTSNPTAGKLARALFYRPFEQLTTNMIFTSAFWVALFLTLTLERLIPAQPNRRIFSVSLAHDLVWFVYEPILNAFVLGTYVVLLERIYTRYFSFLTFTGMAATPGWVRFVTALLLVDLCYWIQHYINHKVPFLWRLHAIHHSQRQLNFFTDFRYHALEYVVRHTCLAVPFLLLRIDPPVIVAVGVVKEWYSRFYHGNIRTNLGPLRFILVTPQSHRIHHSVELRHFDRNFGSIFSFWDDLFGTQYRGADEYPDTGIDDERFPHEQKVSIRSLLLTPWIQMLHPLQPFRDRRRIARLAPESEQAS